MNDEFNAMFEYNELDLHPTNGIISATIIFPDLERKTEFIFKHC